MFHKTCCLTLGLTAGMSLLMAQDAIKPIQMNGRTLDCEVTQAGRGMGQKVSLRDIAEAGMNELFAQFRADIEAGTLPEGFPLAIHDLSELDNAKIGFGFQVHTINAKKLLSTDLPLERLAIPTGTWRFMIMVNDRPIGLANVENVGGKWQMVGVGSAKMAEEVYAVAEAHSAGRDFRFIRIYEATADLMEVADESDVARFVPLMAARQSLGYAKATRGSQLQDGTSVATSLRTAVAATLSASH